MEKESIAKMGYNVGTYLEGAGWKTGRFRNCYFRNLCTKFIEELKATISFQSGEQKQTGAGHHYVAFLIFKKYNLLLYHIQC